MGGNNANYVQCVLWGVTGFFFFLPWGHFEFRSTDACSGPGQERIMREGKERASGEGARSAYALNRKFKIYPAARVTKHGIVYHGVVYL